MTTNMNSEGDSKNILKIKNRNMLEIPFPRIFFYICRLYPDRQTDKVIYLLDYKGNRHKKFSRISLIAAAKITFSPIALRIAGVRTDKVNNREA